jgi:hypothetical protein
MNSVIEKSQRTIAPPVRQADRTTRSEPVLTPPVKKVKQAGLKLEKGPDQRLRLVLDRGSLNGRRQSRLQTGYVLRYEIQSLGEEGFIDGQEDDGEY